MNMVSLCTGYGGLDRAADDVFGGQLVAVADTEAAAALLLAHHYPDVPNVGDIAAVDWTGWSADVVTAGWPCQPWSQAGRREGAADERAIWPHVARAVRELEPRWVVLENVAAVVAAGELARALGDLAALGFDAEWVCVRASDVGAPHRRERLFIVARAAADPADLGHQRPRSPRRRGPGPEDSGVAAADPDGSRLSEPATEPCGVGAAASLGAPARPGGLDQPAADAGGQRHGRRENPRVVGELDCGQEDTARERERARQVTGDRSADGWGPYTAAIRRWERALGRPAPRPTVLGRRGGHQLNPALVEWLMGLPAGWVTDVPNLTRNQQLKLLGNGVVPQQAAHALRLLTARQEATAS